MIDYMLTVAMSIKIADGAEAEDSVLRADRVTDTLCYHRSE